MGTRGAAKRLAGEFNLEALRTSGRLRGPIGARIEEAWEDVLRWRELIRLRTDKPVPSVATGHATAALPRPADMLSMLDLW